MTGRESAKSGQKPLLSLRNINMTFGGVRALKDVSFDVLPGEVHCLAGENGSGKSTLIKIITGVYRPQDGAVIEFDRQTYSAYVAGDGAEFRHSGDLAGPGTVSGNDSCREYCVPDAARPLAAVRQL
ncbi:ATP-binding cassette domain-containing protein [Rhizobium sp. RCAM05350]|nr:ATP-binding cassette domain-containing protein [Rhizobium sp. RCAM05350]